jgi:hypothetical protein
VSLGSPDLRTSPIGLCELNVVQFGLMSVCHMRSHPTGARGRCAQEPHISRRRIM